VKPEQTTEGLKISLIRTLPSDRFKELAQIVRSQNGEYKAEGKEIFLIPKPKESVNP